MSDMSKSVQRRLSLQLPERAKRLEAERDEWKRRAEAAEEAYARVTAAYDEAMDRAEAAEQLAASYAETNAAQRARIKNLQAYVTAAVQRAEKAEAELAVFSVDALRNIFARDYSEKGTEWEAEAAAVNAWLAQHPEESPSFHADWVSVSEQLPQPERTVLAVLRDSPLSTVIIVAQWWPQFTVPCFEPEYEFDTDYDEATEQRYFPAGWYEQTTTGEYSFCGPLSGAVTHWMALPALPEV